MPNSPLRVLLVDDHGLIRDGLRRAFEREEGFVVVGEAADSASAVRLAAELTPDVAIIDIRLPDGNGLTTVKKIRAVSPSMGLVVLTMYAGDQQLLEALEAGASAFVAKSAAADDVINAARHAATAPATFAAADLANVMRRKMHSTGPKLTPREHEVLELLKDGNAIPAIARRLYMSESTVKSHVSKLYEKLGAANRAQAIMSAVRMGFIRTDVRDEVLP